MALEMHTVLLKPYGCVCVVQTAYRGYTADDQCSPTVVTYAAVGDPIEAASLGESLGQAPGRTSPLPVGSMKGNMGHTEPVAGLAGVMKCALMLHHKVLLPTAGFNTW